MILSSITVVQLTTEQFQLYMAIAHDFFFESPELGELGG